MPKSDGISAQYLDEGLIVLNKNLGFSGNAAARTACIKYLDEVDAQCLSKNATFTQDECEKYCGKCLPILEVVDKMIFFRVCLCHFLNNTSF